ncbi:hypothetical protein M0804_013390 [Polistes exclamans]|nr:hypothetical protein M0804_013390 [Polistes exclamans]
MSNEDSLNETQQIIYYRNQALSMMNIFELQEEWFFPTWLNKFEYVADMIEVSDDKMGELFIAMLHDNVHKPIKKNNASLNLSKISYENITNYYLRHYSIYYDINLYRRRFTLRKQYEQEPIKKYANNLHKLHIKCSYTISSEKRLREEFLNGIRDKGIRLYLKKKLSEFSYISFADMVAMAIAFENKSDIIHYLNPAFSMINTYNPEKEGNFYAWLNKFEYVANMIEVPDNRMLEFFGKMVDNDVHQRVRQIFPSVIFSVLLWEELINYYLLYFAPSFESDLHRGRFISRIQYEQETIQKYANNLRKLYNKCSYTDPSEEMLCKQFVNGILDDDIRSHLNKTLYLSLDEIVVKAIAFLNDNQITHYLSQALSMMNIFKLDEKTFFPMWLNKFEYVADIIQVPHDKMGKLFITMMHNDVNKFINNNNQFVNNTELSYDQILDKYRYLFFGTHEIKLHKSRFTYRNQYEHEPIEKYFNNLWKLLKKCSYKNDEERKLREQFVNGIRDDDLRTHLNNISGLSFKKMVAEAILFEKANDIFHYVKPALLIINTYNPMKEGVFYAWLNKFEYVANIVKVPDNKLVKFFIEMVDDNVHTISFAETLEKAISLEKYIEISFYQNQAFKIMNTYNPTKEGIFYEWLNKFEYAAA